MFTRLNYSLLLSIAVVILLTSCASYNQQAGVYYTHLQNGNYAMASESLNDNKLLKRSRNRLLYLMEKGKMEHLLGNFESSNRYFNEADQLMEDSRNTVKDMALSYLINPMMEAYQGEDFEQYMLHYYKAMNYLQLGSPAEALVEAKRITLTANLKEDVAGNKNHYSRDAFSFMIQGMIYETNHEINNAFISYRNAGDIFLENGEKFYGICMPVQLKKDVLRTAYLNGFYDEVVRYEQLFNMKFDSNTINTEGELIVFWENGLSPVKAEQNLLFDLVNDGTGQYHFVDLSRSMRIPFDNASNYNKENLILLTSLRIVLPRYEAQPLFYHKAGIKCGQFGVELEDVQDINELAFSTLKERWLSELTKTLTRLAIKRLAEMAVTPEEKKETDSKDEKKKKDKQAVLATGLKLFNIISEKADTRNWQSLPYRISYTRIPLQRGNNDLTLEVKGNNGQVKTSTFQVENKGALYFKNFCTVRY